MWTCIANELQHRQEVLAKDGNLPPLKWISSVVNVGDKHLSQVAWRWRLPDRTCSDMFIGLPLPV
ncbi:hypothetical protein J6590_003154 [Homalodisca vitripennis]|nr:hypothetical protein J6590_003154 [Homalodisca vitripennis]